MAGSLKAYSGLADVRDLVKLCYEVRNRLDAAADSFATRYGLATWDKAGAAVAFPGLPVALTSEQTDLTAGQVEAQVGQFTAQTQSINIGAEVVNVPAPVAEPVPTVTEQVYERDALGRIVRSVSRSEPVQPVGPTET